MSGREAEHFQRVAAVGYDYAARPKETVEACNLCGCTVHVETAHRDRYGFPAILNICSRCGLGFLSPRLTAEEYADFYAGTYRALVTAYHGYEIDPESRQAEQRGYAVGVVDFLERGLPARPRTLMDIGGSTGAVALEASDRLGSTATVLDPAADELAIAEDSGLETVPGFAEDYDPQGRTWDLVLLCQTIDHLLDVRATLEAMRTMTADGGHLYVDIVDPLFSMRRKGHIEDAVKIDHPYYLVRETARAYFDVCGMEVIGERMVDHSELGFLLRPAEPRDPDWTALTARADRMLEEIWTRRAVVRR